MGGTDLSGCPSYKVQFYPKNIDHISRTLPVISGSRCAQVVCHCFHVLASPPNVPVTILPLPGSKPSDICQSSTSTTWHFSFRTTEVLGGRVKLLLLSPLMLSPFSFLQRGRENGENFKGEKRVADGPDESMLASPSLPRPSWLAAVYPRPCLLLILMIGPRVSSAQLS